MINNDNNDERLVGHLERITSKRINIGPHREAIYITIWYVILGGLWILFSDSLLNFMVKDADVVQKIQFIKGWLYVAITGVYIYVLIHHRVKLLKKAADQIHEGYTEIASLAEEVIEKENEIFELSHYDRMTGLLNWVGLSIAFDHLMALDDQKKYALFYIDIDNIKHVNDTLGHENGNLLLCNIANKLNKRCVNEEILSRVSGDEFIIIIPFDGDDVHLHKTTAKINQLIRTTWKFDRYEFLVTGSIGVSVYPQHGTTLEELIKHADSAMFIAKENGRDQHYLYNEVISKKTQNYVEMITQIRHGITKNEFELYYQPIVTMGSEKLVSAEALIRWHHPKRGFLTPYHFIEIAEESGQINEIGKWVFDTACKQQKLWRDEGYKPIKLSINMSGKRLFDKNLIDDMIASMNRYEVNPKWIQIEITETAVMENLNGAIKILGDIHDLGITLALDDFGTGYSSLTYLQMFPIDVLKIDREFIKNISFEGLEKENNIIKAVLNLAHSLKLDVVAEGIETSEQSEYLLKNDCDYGQGYYFDKPMPVNNLADKYFK